MEYCCFMYLYISLFQYEYFSYYMELNIIFMSLICNGNTVVLCIYKLFLSPYFNMNIFHVICNYTSFSCHEYVNGIQLLFFISLFQYEYFSYYVELNIIFMSLICKGNTVVYVFISYFLSPYFNMNIFYIMWN